MLSYAHAFTSIHMYMHASVHACAFLQSPGASVAQESNELHHTYVSQKYNKSFIMCHTASMVCPILNIMHENAEYSINVYHYSCLICPIPDLAH